MTRKTILFKKHIDYKIYNIETVNTMLLTYHCTQFSLTVQLYNLPYFQAHHLYV